MAYACVWEWPCTFQDLSSLFYSPQLVAEIFRPLLSTYRATWAVIGLQRDCNACHWGRELDDNFIPFSFCLHYSSFFLYYSYQYFCAVFAKHQRFLLSFLTYGYCTVCDELLTPYSLWAHWALQLLTTHSPFTFFWEYKTGSKPSKTEKWLGVREWPERHPQKYERGMWYPSYYHLTGSWSREAAKAGLSTPWLTFTQMETLISSTLFILPTPIPALMFFGKIIFFTRK